MEPIDLSDDSCAGDVIDLGAESNDDVIEIGEINDYKTFFKNDAQYDYLLKENKLLVEFIEKCLDLESTNGMIRVINRSLIPAYYSTTKTFRESEIITTVISKSIRKLDSDPDHKFSHVKDLCNELKKSSQKLDEKLNRWNETLIAKRRILNRKRRKKAKWPPRKKRKPNEIENIIVSDDSDGFEVPIINLDEMASQVTAAEVPLKDCRIKQEVGIIEIEIDNVSQETGTNNEIEAPDNENHPISNTDSSNKILCSNSTQDIFKSGTEDTESSKIRPGANTNNTKKESNTYSAELILQDSNLKPLGQQSNKDAVVCDTEISSTEISSTVNVDVDCSVSVESSRDSDQTIVLNEDELVTTTQEVTEVKSQNANKASSEENLSTVPVISDEKRRVSNKYSDHKDLIVLDEDETHKLPTQKEKKDNVKGITNENRNKVSSKQTSSAVPVLTDHKSSETDLIVLDEDEVITINQEVNQNEVTNLSIASAKENNHGKSNELIQNNDLIVIDDEDNSESIACNNNSINKDKSLPLTEEDTLLVPHKTEVFEGTTEDKLMRRINSIEDEISACKAKITELEEQEVNNDSMWSPYIQCEKYKLTIVKLYKELCILTGERAVKRREVRLKAANARSQLCVDKLEELINTNIGHDGLPHFPDFQDVLQCVRDANKEGQLGWNRNEVMREANSLFTYCGRALQESRKRREWRDMLSLVKSEQIEDPADNDPELMARLQANRQTAVKREKDLLDRYCEMSYLPPSTECTKENDVSNSDSENETENVVEDITSTQDVDRNTTSQLNNNNTSATEPCREDNKFKAMEVLSQNIIKAVFNKPSANSLTESHNDGSHVVRKRCTPIKLEDNKTDKRSFIYSSKTSEVSSNNDPTNILNHNFNLVTKVVLERIELPKLGNVDSGKYSNTDSVKKENMSESDKIEVKKEPYIDIQEELDKLGDNFTATVIDIEDPFLIVEISSDSEDEDDLARDASFVL